jgi:hypothetical protein
MTGGILAQITPKLNKTIHERDLMYIVLLKGFLHKIANPLRDYLESKLKSGLIPDKKNDKMQYGGKHGL